MNKNEFVEMLLASPSVVVRNREILKKVKVADFRALLEKSGWTLQREDKGWIVYRAAYRDDSGNPIDMMLPQTESFADYPARISDAIFLYKTFIDPEPSELAVLMQLLVKE